VPPHVKDGGALHDSERLGVGALIVVKASKPRWAQHESEAIYRWAVRAQWRSTLR
jgi:hypothetical protein